MIAFDKVNGDVMISEIMPDYAVPGSVAEIMAPNSRQSMKLKLGI